MTIDLSRPFIEQLDRRHKLIRFLVLCLFSVALTGGLIITQINVKRGLIVYSSDPAEWRLDQLVPLRIEGRSLPFRQTIQLQEVSARIQSRQATKNKQVFTSTRLSAAIEQMWQGHIKLPNDPGEYRLIIEAKGFEHPSLTKGKPSELPVHLNAQLDFKLTDEEIIAPLWPPLAQTPITARERLGAGTISFYPADQRLTSELPSDLFIVAQNEMGAPWRGEVNLEHLEGLIANDLPDKVATNRSGIAEVSVTPRSMSLRLKSKGSITTIENSEFIEDEITSCDERFQPRAHHFNLIPSTQLVKSGGKLTFKVQSTHASDHLYADLWWGNQWLSTTLVNMVTVDSTVSQGGLKAEGEGYILIPDLPKLRKNVPQLLWLQTYLLPYQIDEVRGGSYLLWSDKETNKDSLSLWFRDQLIASEMEPSAYWSKLPVKDILSRSPLRLGLGRVMRPPASPQVVVNSGESAQITAKRQRSRYMKLYLEFMAALCVVTMMWLITLVTLTYRKQVNHPEWSDPQSIKRARKIAITWLTPMMIILMIFFGAMVLLVFKIQW